jgi:hypothetical protein
MKMDKAMKTRVAFMASAVLPAVAKEMAVAVPIRTTKTR